MQKTISNNSRAITVNLLKPEDIFPGDTVKNIGFLWPKSPLISPIAISSVFVSKVNKKSVVIEFKNSKLRVPYESGEGWLLGFNFYSGELDEKLIPKS